MKKMSLREPATGQLMVGDDTLSFSEVSSFDLQALGDSMGYACLKAHLDSVTAIDGMEWEIDAYVDQFTMSQCSEVMLAIYDELAASNPFVVRQGDLLKAGSLP